MTQTAATPATTTTTPSGLRSLYLIRVIFSLIWVALVFTTSASLKSTDTPTVVAAVLLVTYPLWDAVATFLERHMAGIGPTSSFSAINMALGLAATTPSG
jgi:tryptophan-rich sensory protein